MKNTILNAIMPTLLVVLPLTGMAEEATPPMNDSTSPEVVQKAGQTPKPVRYVDDKLIIMMRSGSSSKHKIMQRISSGTQLEVLDTKGNFSQVRTRNGTIGWVLSRYLATEPIARHRLKAADKQLEKLTTENNQLQTELAAITKQHDKLTKQTSALSEQLENFRTAAAKPIQLQEENQGLLKTKVNIENDNELLKQEVQILRDQSQKHWFLAGAGVLLAGTFLGLMIPKMRRRRKSDWGSL